MFFLEIRGSDIVVRVNLVRLRLLHHSRKIGISFDFISKVQYRSLLDDCRLEIPLLDWILSEVALSEDLIEHGGFSNLAHL